MGRLDMINAVAKTTWVGKDVLDDWSVLYDEARRNLTQRGKIAHLVGHSYRPDGRGKVKAVLMDPIYKPNSPKTHSQANSVQYNAKRLTELAMEWSYLSEKLGAFILLAGLEGSPQKSDEVATVLRQIVHDPIPRTRRGQP